MLSLAIPYARHRWYVFVSAGTGVPWVSRDTAVHQSLAHYSTRGTIICVGVQGKATKMVLGLASWGAWFGCTSWVG